MKSLISKINDEKVFEEKAEAPLHISSMIIHP